MVQGQPLKSAARAVWIIRALPEGALKVGFGLVLSGLAAYGFLVVSARALDPVQYAGLSALWAIAALVGPGLFLPVEQELSRAISARRAAGDGARPIIARAARLGILTVAGLLVLVLILSSWLEESLFDGSEELLLAFTATMVTYLAIYLAKGVLSGVGAFGAYSLLLVIEGFARLGGSLALFAAGVSVVGGYAAVFAAAPLVAAAFALPHFKRQSDGSPSALKEISSSIGYLLAASLLAQTVINFGPLVVKALASPSEEAAAGHFLAGLIVARVPLFLFAAIYTPLLPRLSALATLGRMKEFIGGVKLVTLVVLGIGVLATAGAYAAGPDAVRALFGEGFELGRMDLFYLAAGSSLYMLALATSQALIALSGHRFVPLAWLVGVLALLVVTFTSEGLLVRVELGFLAGSAGAGAAMFGLLWWAIGHRRLAGPPPPESLIEVPLEP